MNMPLFHKNKKVWIVVKEFHLRDPPKYTCKFRGTQLIYQDSRHFIRLA